MAIPSWINRTNLYYAGLTAMLIALPLSRALMSMSQLFLSALWLLDPKILQKWKMFFRNRAAMVIVSVFILHIIGLLWTTDFDYAVKDLRTKIPLLALPIIISTSPKVNRSLFHYLMFVFIIANVLGTIASMHELLTKEIADIRDISLFMSHVRFSLNICVAIFAGLYLIFGSGFFNLKIKIALFVTIIWLVFFLVILESVTGLSILIIVGFLLALLTIFKSKSKVLKITIAAFLVAIPMLLFFYLKNLYDEAMPDEPFRHKDMVITTSKGNFYGHDSTITGIENGHWVGQYIQWTEIKEEWGKRSSITIDSIDNSGHYIRYTLLRYLSSKGLRKDAEAIQGLTDDEIRHIENGIANINELTETSIQNRMRAIVWEMMIFKQTGFMSGHSVAQRLEFWRAGLHIIQKNFWLGTGTGDIKEAYANEYVEMNSQLESQFRWRAHNQYLAIFAALGFFGWLWFMFALIYPGYHLKMFDDYFYLVFFLILALSMLSEDTIENQAGVTFFTFFTVFFLFARSNKMTIFSQNKTDDNG